MWGGGEWVEWLWLGVVGMGGVEKLFKHILLPNI